MRLWSLHPKYLDVKGLTAVWREALLAQTVLRGRTKGYRNHPQLARFRAHRQPRRAINAYLWHVRQEALARGYAFDARKVRRPGAVARIGVNRGQVAHEAEHLMKKLRQRDPHRWAGYRTRVAWDLHPLMKTRAGTVEAWERL